MRAFHAAAMIAILAGPASAQNAVPRYGDMGKPKTPQQIEGERAAERSYKNSLDNIPDKGPADPWGNVRSDSAPKPVAKPSPGKAQAKTSGAAN